MKLVRFGPKGREKPGVIDADGTIRDISSVVSDIGPDTISPTLLRTLKKTDLSQLPAAPKKARLGSPISRTNHFIAIGLNYADHAAETGAAIPKEPIIFSKAPNCLSGPYDDVLMPRGSKKLDWEVEIAVIIGKKCDYVSEDKALSHVFGYALCNDVSEREYQSERGGQWMKGKSAPTFGPLGPWLVTADEIKDPQNLDMFLHVNGKRRQTGKHVDDDLHDRSRRLLSVALHGAGAGRRHHDRHPSGRCARHEEAGVPQGRRRDAPGHRWARRTAPEGRGKGLSERTAP